MEDIEKLRKAVEEGNRKGEGRRLDGGTWSVGKEEGSEERTKKLEKRKGAQRGIHENKKRMQGSV
ncbi:hypothetical protein K0M31_012578 [Melipona bicolor]|uniref:Uncharacterized protein n=1 Tax=Melipona bicolor TaxID=60889 RepID=A0AA40FJF3_9HYME|nr:hypothetical protein K0M31_012578 [Melipona bicolor]